ncbi:hypothetical protein pb186bvf_018453 [Paramecium bursaria]
MQPRIPSQQTPQGGPPQSQIKSNQGFLDPEFISPGYTGLKEWCFVSARHRNTDQSQKHDQSQFSRSQISFNEQVHLSTEYQKVEQAQWNTQMGNHQNIGRPHVQKESKEQHADHSTHKSQIMWSQHIPSQLANQIPNQQKVKNGSQKQEVQGPLGSNENHALHGTMLMQVQIPPNHDVKDGVKKIGMKSEFKVIPSQQQIQSQQQLQSKKIIQSHPYQSHPYQNVKVNQQYWTSQHTSSQKAIQDPFPQSSFKSQSKMQSKFNYKGSQFKENDI